MTNSKPGYGSKFFMSSSGAVGSYQPAAQLKSFIPQGSKQALMDQTNVLTPDNFDRPIAVMVASGEIDLVGILDPANSQILQLGVAHASLALYFFLVVLPDGTQWTFSGPGQRIRAVRPVTYNKAIGFTAKIRVSGSMTGPAGSA